MIGEGNPKPTPSNVHIYGELEMDNDKMACASLGPKFMDYPTLGQYNLKFEGRLANTKSRWSRITTGGPRDQEQDEEEFETNQTEEEHQNEVENKLVYS